MATNTPTPGGLPTSTFTPMNPAGLSADTVGDQLKMLEDATNSLASRYDNPNWFNVAAGFFKPQLGGFAASLGSAAQAMGDNVEKQRENMLPVATMRAEMGRLGSLQKQKTQADAIFSADRLKNQNKPVHQDILGQLQQLDPNGPAYQGAKATNEELSRKAAQEGQQVSTGAAQAAALGTYSPDLYSALPLDNRPPAEVASFTNALRAAAVGIAGVDPKKLENMTAVQLQDLLHKNTNEKTTQAALDKTTANGIVTQSSVALDSFAPIRVLVDKPDLDKLLGTTKGRDALSLFVDFLKTGKRDPRYDTALAGIASDSDQAFADFQTLTKLLSANSAQVRASMENPSMQSTDIATAMSPNTALSAQSIRKIVDLMAHDAYSKGEIAQFTQDYQGDPAKMQKSPEFKTMRRNLETEKREIVQEPARKGLGRYYSLYAPAYAPRASNSPPAAQAAQPGVPAPTSGVRVVPSGWVRNKDGSFSKTP